MRNWCQVLSNGSRANRQGICQGLHQHVNDDYNFLKLTPPDFLLSPTLKSTLMGKRHDLIEAVQQAVTS